MLLCVGICLFAIVSADYLDVNGCFSQRSGFEVSVRVNQVKTTSVVEMKDECLRSCLKTLIEPGAKCLSILHMPKDNDCIIAEAVGQTIGRVNTPGVMHQNYYENECAKLPEGGHVEARLQGFRGPQGVLQLAQKKGKNPKILVIMTGLAAGRDYNIHYAPELELDMCKRVNNVHNANIGEKLITVDADPSGMGIQPWTEIPWHILDDDVLDKVLVVSEKISGLVIDCGKIAVLGDRNDWEAALNSAHPASAMVYLATIVTFFVALLR
ncbi:unnamed protein product, partial [Mesorhabditis spiculigera]